MKMADLLSYKKLSEIEHVLHRPSMYGADLSFVKRDNEYVAKIVNGEIVCELIKLDISDALERIFLEIISNAGDNVQRSKMEKINPGIIRIKVEGNLVSIYNEGVPIPIDVHPTEHIHIPELIFGNLRAGSNFDDEQISKNMLVGQNGIGGKLTNIFSKSFDVDIVNNNMRYQQHFYDNMYKKDKPVITEYKSKNYTKISYMADFNRLYEDKTLKDKGVYTDNIVALYRKYALDVAFACNIPVYFNEIEIKINDIEEYSKFFIKKLEIPNPPVIINYKESSICLYDLPNENKSVSIVNGLNTKRGGVHVESWLKALTKLYSEVFKKQKKTITTEMVKRNIVMFLSCRVPNPKFSSQSKELLTSPKVETNIPKKDEAILLKWKVVERLSSMINTKDEIEMKKIDGKKTTYINIADVDEANLAGTANSSKCSIFITEGKSAKTTAISGIKYMAGGRELYGAFPIRGKFINVNGKKLKLVAGNREVQMLKKVLGLREGVDYEDDKEFNTLRYGSVIIFADADDDGLHIVGLLMNFFMTLYPSLVKRNYVKRMYSPILKVHKGKKELSFITKKEYDDWLVSESNTKSWNHSYYKGLGTHDDSGIKKMFATPVIQSPSYDDMAENSMNMAFGKEQENARKQWIEEYDKDKEITPIPDCSITSFVKEELIEYSLRTIQRAIPLYMDGLKESQRKILYIMMKHPKKEKVVSWSGMIITDTMYHHGDVSLQAAIVKLGQDFPGSNNVPLVQKDGQFGTILEGGDDAASARYISASIASITKWIIRKEDECILKYKVDEAKQIEPYEYYPIIPLLLINGSNGIAVGWSTNIPSYNPKDIITWIKQWLEDIINYKLEKEKDENASFIENERITLIPWYKNYNGNIYLNDKGDIVNEGIFEMRSDRTVQVTALPISKCVAKYKEDLQDMIDKNQIVNFKNLSCDDNVDIRIVGMLKPTLKKLKLESKIGTTNITTIDKDGKPIKFRNVTEFLKYFCTHRLIKYEKRKNVITTELEKQLKEKTLFISFIDDVISEKIKLIGSEENLKSEMKKRKYPDEFLDRNLRSLTEKRRIAVGKEIEEIKIQIDTYTKLDPAEIWMKELVELQKHL